MYIRNGFIFLRKLCFSVFDFYCCNDSIFEWSKLPLPYCFSNYASGSVSNFRQYV